MPTTLDYGPRVPLLRRRGFRRRVLLGGLVLLVAAWFVASLWIESGEYSSYVCTDCGLRKSERIRQLAVIPIPFYRSHTPRPTPISGVVARHNLMAGHTHHWRFVQGGGQGTLAAYTATGDKWLPTMVQDVTLVDFINNLASSDRSAAERWLKGILQSRQGRKLLEMLWFDDDYRTDVLNKPANFPAWWAKNQQKLEQHLAEAQRKEALQE